MKRFFWFVIVVAALLPVSFFSASGKNGILLFCIAGIVLLLGAFVYTRFARSELGECDFSIRVLILMVAAGLVMRLFLADGDNFFPTDIGCFAGWSSQAYGEGLDRFYTSGQFVDYPPLYVYVMYVLGAVKNALPELSYAFLVKIPAILCDIVLGIWIYRTARRKTTSGWALFLAGLILLNPAVCINSAMWGQIDVIYTLMIALVLYLLVLEKLAGAVILFIFAVLLKPQALLIAPVGLFYLIDMLCCHKKRRTAIVQLSVGAGVGICLAYLALLPFADGRSPGWIVDLYQNSLSTYPYLSVNGFNLYALLGLNWQPINEYTGLVSVLSAGAVCAVGAYAYFKKRDRTQIFFCAAWIILGIYLFSHGMHERYTFAVPVLLLLSFVFTRQKSHLWLALMMFASNLLMHGIVLWHQTAYIQNGIMMSVSIFNMVIFARMVYDVFRRESSVCK